MTPEQTRALIRRLAHRMNTNTSDEGEGELHEPVAEFFDPARFERERRQFFFETPQVVGFAGEVRAPGSVLRTEILGTPILITRDEGGALHAFINACGHRGAQLEPLSGGRTSLRCRFHGWSYQLDGRLHARPQAACFGPAGPEHDLRRLPVSDRAGLLVVGPDPAMPQERVDHHLDAIAGELEGFALHELHALETRRYEVRANWKLIAALSYESYHFATLHRDSVAQVMRPNFVYDTFGDRHSRWAFGLKGTEGAYAGDEGTWPPFVLGAVSHALFPGTVMITNPLDAQIIRAEPGPTVDTSVVYYVGVYRNLENRDAALSAYQFGGKAFEDEDLPAAVECQRGLLAGRDRLVVAKNEPVLQFWMRRWREDLR